MTNPAIASYGGYEYQIYVTAHLACDLILVRELCDHIEVEPSSLDDVQADLQVDQNVPTPLLGAPISNSRYDIQVKQRSSKLWSAAELRNLIAPKGAEPGASTVIARLQQDADLNFVLITNAQVHSDLANFVVDAVGVRSRGRSLSSLPIDPAVLERISILPERHQRLITHELDTMLELRLRVPFQHVAACRSELFERVRVRLLGRAPTRLHRDELTSIVQKHAGLPPGVAEEFVEPLRFDDVRRKLEGPPYAVLLSGPPGIGKTFAAEQLIAEHRRLERPFEILTNPTIPEIRVHLSKPGRSLFYLEDPWGRYQVEAGGESWSDEIPRLIGQAGAHPDKRFVITSRTTILADSLVLAPQEIRAKVIQRLGAYVVTLETSDFDHPRRYEILRRYLRRAQRWQREWAEDVAQDVVARLELPQAIAGFARKVMLLSREGAKPELDSLINDSQVEAITSMVSTFAAAPEVRDTCLALWVFLRAAEPLTSDGVERFERRLRGREGLAPDFQKVIEAMEANGWLRWWNGALAAHPSVIEGLEQVALKYRSLANQVTNAILTQLLEEDVEVAARLARRLGDRVVIQKPIAAAIAAHLRQAILQGPDEKFVTCTDLFFRAHHASDDPLALLVSALLTVDDTQTLDTWTAPVWTSDQHEAIFTSPEAEQFLRRWIRLGFFYWRTFFGDDQMYAFLQELPWDIGPELTSAAIEGLREAATSSAAEAAAVCMSADHARILEEALAAYDHVSDWFASEGAPEQRRAEEGELDVVYSTRVVEEPAERFEGPRTALKVTVAALRKANGYRWLCEHPRRRDLVEEWSHAIACDSVNAGEDEWAALLEVSNHSRCYVWTLIGRKKRHRELPRLFEATMQGPLEDFPFIWAAIFGLYAPSELRGVLEAFVASLSWPRRVAFLNAAGKAYVPYGVDQQVDAADHRAVVLELLSPMERVVYDHCVARSRDKPPASTLDVTSLELVAQLCDGPDDELAAVATLILVEHGRRFPETSRRLLSHEDNVFRLQGLRALASVRPALNEELEPFLRDSHFRCRRVAAIALSEILEYRDAIIGLARDRSAPVRETCVRLIGAHRWVGHSALLCDLLRDPRDRAGMTFNNEVVCDCHVGRRAAWALGKFVPLEPEVLNRVVEFLEEGRRASKDVQVHSRLVSILAQHQHESTARIVSRLWRSEWRIGGPGGSFPLRYSALWSWVSHLLLFPADAASIPAQEIVVHATHPDGRIAAPALTILGMMTPSPEAELQTALLDAESSEHRRLLLDAARCRVGAEPVRSKDSPGGKMLSWLWDEEMPDADWTARYEQDSAVLQLVAELQTTDPVCAALRALMLRAPRGKLIPNLRADDFRRDELPASTPLITLFGMSGGE